MNRVVSPLAVASVAGFVAFACDFVYGVNRRADVVNLPRLECIRSAIESTPGVQSVEYRTWEGGRPITLTGLKPPDQVHTFLYRGEGVAGAVQFIANYKGDIHFSDTLLDINRKPSQELVDRTRPVMRAIEANLEVRCGVSNLVQAMSESCSGVECPSL